MTDATPRKPVPQPAMVSETPWFVYILQCSDDSLYTGITNDLGRRLKQHNAGTASRYTRSRLPVRQVFHESQPSRSRALQREAVIKALPRRKKIELISSALDCVE